jgi:hypothetical protein
VHPDLFITIAFVSLVVAFALAGLVVALHERRRERAAVEQDAAAREGGGNRASATAESTAASSSAAAELEERPLPSANKQAA